MTTKVVQWGNSDAVRIPKEMLRRVGLKRGDTIEIEINAAGRLELLPSTETHRRVVPTRKILAEELFRTYNGNRLDNRDAWPNDDLIGAEREAWQS